MPASALYRTAENVSRMSSHRDSRGVSDKWRLRRPKLGLEADVGVVEDMCARCEGLDELASPGDGSNCALSGRRRRGTGGGDALTDLDRPKRGEEGIDVVEVEVEVGKEVEAAAGEAEMLEYSVVVLRFGCTGGGRSVVGREGDEERD